MSRIQDVFIHEAIERWSINFYLAITVDPSRGGTLGDDTGMEVVQVFQVRFVDPDMLQPSRS